MSGSTDSHSILRILLHGFFLISANLFSIMVAFAAVKIWALPPGKLFQGSFALITNTVVYLMVYKLMSGIQREIMEIDDFSMFVIVLLVSMALLPAIFYPIHYLAQGYWSSFDNLLATWPFQLIVNGICLVMNYFILGKRD
ncbi:MAG: hypothetical protein MI975_12445 [Cytophagales bacterium]|nr:hypothetical protein [Cytophagales bacterium]